MTNREVTLVIISSMPEYTEDDVTLPSDHDLRAVIRYGMEAIRLTREYVEPTVNLPAIEGWSWFDWVVWASAALGEDVPAWALPPHSPHEDAAKVQKDDR